MLNHLVQLLDAFSVHPKIRQEFIICHIRTIVEHPFPITAPCSVWHSKCITWWFQSKQLDCHIMIKIIIEAFLCIQVKAQICLYYTAFGYSFQFLQQICSFWESRHFGVVNHAGYRLVYVGVSAGPKIFGFQKKICFVINWQPLLN